MDWRDVNYEHLLKAMDFVDRVGVKEAREQYNRFIAGSSRGFRPANTVTLGHVGRDGEYEHRVLIAIAHRLQFPDRPRLRPIDFHGIDHKEFFHQLNNRIGPRFGWSRIVPDPEEERAFYEGFASATA